VIVSSLHGILQAPILLSVQIGEDSILIGKPSVDAKFGERGLVREYENRIAPIQKCYYWKYRNDAGTSVHVYTNRFLNAFSP
jgi:hypothetical protein